jgi:putative ABC transport system substrate-binding protein
MLIAEREVSALLLGVSCSIKWEASTMNYPRWANSTLVLRVVLTVLLLSAISCQKTSVVKAETQRSFRIGVVYTEPHPVLREIIAAFEKGVTRELPNAQFVEKHGSGSMAQYPAVVRSVLNANIDLLVPITTPMSVEALKQSTVPVLFLGVTDPVGANVVDSIEHPRRSTGVSDNPPMAGVIALVRRFLPNAKTIGIPYDPKDEPGVITAHRAEQIGQRSGFRMELSPVTSENELRAAVRSLADRTDALVIGMDNLMMKNAGIIAQTARLSGKPLFAADDKSVAMGAVAGVGVNYADVGRLGANMAAQVLAKKLPVGSLPVVTLATGDIFVNETAAKGLGLALPDHIRSEGKVLTQK